VNKILVGLLSCQSTQARRELCRATWLPVLNEFGIEVLFLVGGCEHMHITHDTLYLPVSDTYNDLPQKTIAFCRWALAYTPATHLFKADDDTFIHPQRFARFVESIPNDKEYVGNEWRPRAGYASGGAGYLLSRRAAELVASHRKLHGAEDIMTGEIMRNNKIPMHRDHRFIAFGNEQRRPLPENDLITTHKISVELWSDTWARYEP
jgi:hypothetical protein